MDPALWELLRDRASFDGAEIEAIIRLDRPDDVPAGVRLVARFGTISTCRLPIDAIERVRAHPNVLSLKAPRLIGPASPIDGREPAVRPKRGMAQSRGPRGGGLDGAGVVVGIVDFGADVDCAAFTTDVPGQGPDSGRRRGGSRTRILALWDQRGGPHPRSPQPYGYGRVHWREDIDAALRGARPYRDLDYHPSISDPNRLGSHGTHVMDIATGNGRAGGPIGVAPAADIAFVHLDNSSRQLDGLMNMGDSARILEAVSFIATLARHARKPWVINLSIGRHGGPHNGCSLVEESFDWLMANDPQGFLVVSAGNYANKRIHASGQLKSGAERTLTFVVHPRDSSGNELEIWYPGSDEFVVALTSPTGAATPRVPLGRTIDVIEDATVVGRVYHRRDPNADHHIDVFLDAAAPPGRWLVTLHGARVADGTFHAWLERDEACRRCQARFVAADADPSFTIGTLATGRFPLVVGAYDSSSADRAVAPFSSAGPTRTTCRPKPDLVAPGVNVAAARSAPAGAHRSPGGLVAKSGTSMAAPQVTGAVALCLSVGCRSPDIRRLILGTAQPLTHPGSSGRAGRGALDLDHLADRLRSLRDPVATTSRPFRALRSAGVVEAELTGDGRPGGRVSESSNWDGWHMTTFDEHDASRDRRADDDRDGVAKPPATASAEAHPDVRSQRLVREQLAAPTKPVAQAGPSVCVGSSENKIAAPAPDEAPRGLTGRYEYTLTGSTRPDGALALNQAGRHLEVSISRYSTPRRRRSHFFFTGDLDGDGFTLVSEQTAVRGVLRPSATGLEIIDEQGVRTQALRLEPRPTLFPGPILRISGALDGPSALGRFGRVGQVIDIAKQLASALYIGPHLFRQEHRPLSQAQSRWLSERFTSPEFVLLLLEVAAIKGDLTIPTDQRTRRLEAIARFARATVDDQRRGLHRDDLPSARVFVRRLLSQGGFGDGNRRQSYLEWIQFISDLTDTPVAEEILGVRPSRRPSGDYRYRIRFDVDQAVFGIGAAMGELLVEQVAPRRWGPVRYSVWMGAIGVGVGLGRDVYEGEAQSSFEWTRRDFVGHVERVEAEASGSVAVLKLGGSAGFLHIYGSGKLPPLLLVDSDHSITWSQPKRAERGSVAKKRRWGFRGITIGLSGKLGTVRAPSGLREADLTRSIEDPTRVVRGAAQAELYFCFDSALLTPAARQRVRITAATWLPYLAMPQSSMTITGFADRAGDPLYNRELSRRRAQNTLTAFQDVLGPDLRAKVDPPEGRGEAFAKAGGPHAGAADRRVDVLLNGVTILVL